MGVLCCWGTDSGEVLLLAITVLPITMNISLLTLLPTLYLNHSSFENLESGVAGDVR